MSQGGKVAAKEHKALHSVPFENDATELKSTNFGGVVVLVP